MNYQITCACGNRFFVTEEQLGRHVTCPTCNRALIPLTAQPDPSPSPGAGTDAPGTLEPTRRCPFCGEPILAIAKKCKHCGEFLDRTPTAPTAAPPTSPTAPAPGSPDEPIFDLRVSQWDNFWKYIICFTLFVIVTAVLWLVPYLKENYAVVGVPGVFVLLSFIAWFFYLSARNSRCIIRPNRIETEVGIFAKRIDAVDIIRGWISI